MLGVGSRIRVARQPAPHELAIRRDAIAEIGVDDVEPVAARHRVRRGVVLGRHTIAARSRDDRVAPSVALEEVGSRSTGDEVAASAPTNDVRRDRPDERVRPGRPVDRPRDRPRGAQDESDECDGGESHSSATTIAVTRGLHLGDYDPVSWAS